MDTCICGHAIDEHDDSFIAKCTILGCDCLTYEEFEDEDDDDLFDLSDADEDDEC